MSKPNEIHEGHFVVVFLDDEPHGMWHVSSRRFETEAAARTYAAGVSPSRDPVVLEALAPVNPR